MTIIQFDIGGVPIRNQWTIAMSGTVLIPVFTKSTLRIMSVYKDSNDELANTHPLYVYHNPTEINLFFMYRHPYATNTSTFGSVMMASGTNVRTYKPYPDTTFDQSKYCVKDITFVDEMGVPLTDSLPVKVLDFCARNSELYVVTNSTISKQRVSATDIPYEIETPAKQVSEDIVTFVDRFSVSVSKRDTFPTTTAYYLMNTGFTDNELKLVPRVRNWPYLKMKTMDEFSACIIWNVTVGYGFSHVVLVFDESVYTNGDTKESWNYSNNFDSIVGVPVFAGSKYAKSQTNYTKHPYIDARSGLKYFENKADVPFHIVVSRRVGKRFMNGSISNLCYKALLIIPPVTKTPILEGKPPRHPSLNPRKQ
jgi:hypothetical protein